MPDRPPISVRAQPELIYRQSPGFSRESSDGERKSRSRLFFFGCAEQAGTGTLDMIALSREAGLKAPQFRQDGGSFVQTLWRPTAQATGQATVQAGEEVKSLWASAVRELIERASRTTGQATGQASVALLAYLSEPKTTKELQEALGLRHRETFLDNYLKPMLEAGLLERTIPDKPTSPNQQYRLTAKGREWLSANL